MPNFSVVILTAIPTSLGADGAGAFVKVDGRECLLRSADLFFNRDAVKQIQLVVADDKFEEVQTQIRRSSELLRRRSSSPAERNGRISLKRPARKSPPTSPTSSFTTPPGRPLRLPIWTFCWPRPRNIRSP